MRPNYPFDAKHDRCIFPVFGKQFDAALDTAGLTATDVAKRADISPEVVRGYRRGFTMPSPTTQKRLEKILGTAFDTSERRTGGRKSGQQNSLTAGADASDTADVPALRRQIAWLGAQLVAAEKERDELRARLSAKGEK